ncbi:MAG: hypothetical protein ACLFQJ_10550 [Campylobacterales bacterium]
METITLRVHESISENIRWFLSHFSSSEIEVVESVDVTQLHQEDFDYLSKSELEELKRKSKDYKTGKRDDFEEYIL